MRWGAGVRNVEEPGYARFRAGKSSHRIAVGLGGRLYRCGPGMFFALT